MKCIELHHVTLAFVFCCFFFLGGVVNFLLFCFFYFVALSFRWLKCFSIDNQSHCGNRKYIFAVLIVQKKFSLTIHWMPNLFKIKPLHSYIWYVIATYQKQKHEEYYFNNHKLLNATRPTEYLIATCICGTMCLIMCLIQQNMHGCMTTVWWLHSTCP